MKLVSKRCVKTSIIINFVCIDQLLSFLKRLLNQGHEVPFKQTSDKLVLANEMGSFFVEKIDAIHVKLDRLASRLFA